MVVILEDVPGARQLGVSRTDDVPVRRGDIRAVLSCSAVVSPSGSMCASPPIGPEQRRMCHFTLPP